ncbi:DUF6712 family protein [Sphingobacterium multivorum]|uniref:DUF6712 family protein n=1 Tax=Sphingobacterium multivorum TaxID=28454 RepID=UPI0028A8399E|nr:hypothetical protein [Sphingobacterium multivorum]
MTDKDILFISSALIKKNSIIEENVTDKVIRITLKEVQDLELFPILGDTLYGRFENQKYLKSQDSNFEYDDDIQILNKYVKDFLIYGVLLAIPNALNYKYTNKGTVNITDANADNIVGGNIESVKKFYRTKYDAYRKRLVDYVNKCNATAGSVVAPFSTGWFLTDEPNYAEIAKARANKTGW